MKKIIGFALTFCIGIFAPFQNCLIYAEEKPGSFYQSLQVGDEEERKTYSNFITCNGEEIFVEDIPRFEQEGFKAYAGPFGNIVINVKDPDYCLMSGGGGWKVDGFIQGQLKDSQEKILLFKISGEGIVRFFDVKRKKEVFKSTQENIFSDQPLPEPGTLIPVVQEWTGINSNYKEESYLRITNQEDWQKLWQNHAPDQAVPEVDFTKNIVMGIFKSKGGNFTGMKMMDARELEDVFRVRFKLTGYQSMGQGDHNIPFGIFVLHRTEKPIRIEEEIQKYIGGPQRWELKTELKD